MDEVAFRSFYARTARRLRAYLVGSTRNPTLADDLLQESFYRLLRSGFDTDDEQHRKNYLYRIATNLVRDHYRSHRETVELEPETRSAEGAPDAVVLRTELSGAMRELSERDRMMLWLAYVEGASHREIGDCLELKPASIRSMLHRARQRLAAALRLRGFKTAGGTS
jgi:RNA polymerase sigma-70 factor (ECF subfamily)